MVGAAAAGKAIEKLGRRVVVILTAFPFIVGWIAIACSSLLANQETPKLLLLFTGRALTGGSEMGVHSELARSQGDRHTERRALGKQT